MAALSNSQKNHQNWINEKGLTLLFFRKVWSTYVWIFSYNFNTAGFSLSEWNDTDNFSVKQKRWGKKEEWHVAWLAEWHNYAEFNSWKMTQRNKFNRKAWVRLPRLFWRQFEGAIALPVHLLLLLKQGSNWNTADTPNRVTLYRNARG